MFKRLQAWANRQEMAPEPYSFLPAVEPWPSDPPDPAVPGWWIDPLSSDDVTQRYYDGKRWTPYVSLRTAQRWTQIIEDRTNEEVDPKTLGIPRPPVSPDAPTETPTAGWWQDPLEPKLKQARYFDGTDWTDLVAPTKPAGPRLVSRRRDPKEAIRKEKSGEGPGES